MSELSSAAWQFLAHPAFAVFEPTVRERLSALRHFPEATELRGLTAGISNASSLGFEFAPQVPARLTALGGFDRAIQSSGRIPTRPGSFHDLLGALVWMHFPALKYALHQIQLAAAGECGGPAQRAATHLDESGVLLVSSEPSLFESLIALNWSELFWQRRAELMRCARFLGFGHGLLDSLRAPHARLMGKALLVRVPLEALALDVSGLRVFIDRALAPLLERYLVGPARLQPLPVLGIPTWTSGQGPAFYAKTDYFRGSRQSPAPPVDAGWVELGGD